MNTTPLLGRLARRRPATPHRSARPLLECLEDRTAPAATPFLTGPAGVATEQDPTFTWTTVPGADHYAIQVLDRTTGRMEATDGQIVGTSWVAPGSLDAGHTYRTWVRAVSPGGTVGAWSDFREVTIVHPLTGWYSGILDGTMTTGGQTTPVSQPVTFRVTSGGVILISSPGPGTGTVTFAGEAEGHGWLPGLANSSYTLTGTFALVGGSGEADGVWSSTWTGGEGSGTWLAAQTSPAVLSTPAGSGPIESISSRTPMFTWNAVAGADSYEVRLDDLTVRRTGVFDVHDITGTTVPAPVELTVGHRYQWLVRAWRDDGSASGWSVPLPFAAQLAQPTLIAPIGTHTALSPTFSWTAVAGADTYRLQVRDLTTGRPIIDQQGTETTFVPPDPLVLGHRYQWTVQPQQVGGLSGPAGVATVVMTVGTPSALTPTPPLLNARPTFSWTAAIHADHYEVWVDDLSRYQFPAYRNARVFDTAWTPGTALVPGDVYRWRVRGVSAGGVIGPWSSWSTFIVTPLARPMASGPSGVAVPTRPTFAWTAVSEADAYDVTVTDLTTGRLAVRVTQITDSAWTPAAALPLGHRYRWQVRAVNASGNYSPWSAPLTFTATLALSVYAASPGQTLTVRGAGFNPALPTCVVFTSADGLETRVPVAAPTATQMIVVVPPYVDRTTVQVGAGTVSVAVVQTRADGTTTTTGPITRDFAIADLPATGVAAGTWTAAYLAELVTLIDHTIPDYQAIALASGGAVDVSAVLSALQGWRDQLAGFQTQVAAIRNGGLATVALGSVRDVPVELNGDALGLLDRILAAALRSTDPATVSSAAPVALAVTASYAPEQEVWDQVKQRCREYVTGQLGRLEKAVRSAHLFTALADLALHGSIPLPDDATRYALATAATGGLFGAAVYYPWVVVPCLQATANLLKQGNRTGLHAYHQSMSLAGLPGLGAAVETHVGAAAHAGDLLDTMRQVAANGAAAVRTYLTVNGPQIEACFYQALSKLRSPAATLDPPADPGFSLTALADDPNPTATLRVTNTGEALSSLYCWAVSGPSGRILIQDSTRHNLLPGEMWEVPFEVNIAGLDPYPHWQFDLEVRYYRRGVLQAEVVPVELNLRGIRLSGYVRDNLTRRPIAGATVQVVHNAATYTAVSAGNGSYRLIVPSELRDQAALVSVQVSAAGYVDRAIPVNLAAGNQAQTFYLIPQRSNVILVEAGLHHLGDSSFEGTMNSGLQIRAAEGPAFTAKFLLTDAQMNFPYSSAWLELTVNGAECGDLVSVNGHEVGSLTNSAPGPDELSVRLYDFRTYLHAGENTLRIESVVGWYGDLDDFEFSNVHLRLV
ncbi:MAG: hypothetical protein U0736_02395 [Gemmataceae bacterium]